jgi:hypothetical protein
MSSKPRKLQTAQSQAFKAVEGSPDLLDLLEIATTTTLKENFITSLLNILPSAFDQSDKTKPEDLFLIFTSWFGTHAHSNLFPRISAAIKQRKHYLLEIRFKKREFISDIGLDWTAAVKTSVISKVSSAFVIVRKSSCFY